MDEVQKNSMEFIKNELIPEMIYNRCFCDRNSREFVELESVHVEPWKNSKNDKNRELYKGKVTIKFSGEPKIFNVIIKLLPITSGNENHAYNCFINEEMFYNKMTAQYQLDIYPKCYAADMGRYERPVIVLEDLEAAGFIQSTTELDEYHLQMYLRAISKFHGCGFKLKHNKFDIFHEFYVKFNETMIKNDFHIQSINKVLDYLRKKENQQKDAELVRQVRKVLGHVPDNLDIKNDEFYTICHGSINQNHLVFRYENNKPVDIKILGWNQLKYNLPGTDLQLLPIIGSDKIASNALESAVIEKFNDYFNVLTVECPELSKELLFKNFLLSIIYLHIFPNHLH